MQKAAGVKFYVFSMHRVAAHLLARVPGTFEGHSDTTNNVSGGATATTKQTHERTQQICRNILTIILK